LAEEEKKELKKALEWGIFLGRQGWKRQVEKQRQIEMRIRDKKRF
jgi:hypothetical protein